MRFGIVTLFPEMFASFLEAGLLHKAIEAGTLEVALCNPRDFTTDRHRTVDDTPYGGGSGMVMMPGPLAQAMEDLDARGLGAGAGRSRRRDLYCGGRAHRVLLTPQGAPMTQARAARFSGLGAVTLVCGRYEGFDERVRALVDEEVSIGDFVLFGGEVAAMAIVEATARLLPGVLGNEGSLSEESHAAGLLEYPQYTRPAVFRGMEVPAVLRSGDHAAIARWRRKEALRRTRARRPDLLDRLALGDEDRALLAEIEAEAAKEEPE
ncbi:MAG: tRNA (guanosine(37)-N1)-methyltransferase TrmD [Polyangiales bacterium]